MGVSVLVVRRGGRRIEGIFGRRRGLDWIGMGYYMRWGVGSEE